MLLFSFGLLNLTQSLTQKTCVQVGVSQEGRTSSTTNQPHKPPDDCLPESQDQRTKNPCFWPTSPKNLSKSQRLPPAFPAAPQIAQSNLRPSYPHLSNLLAAFLDQVLQIITCQNGLSSSAGEKKSCHCLFGEILGSKSLT